MLAANHDLPRRMIALDAELLRDEPAAARLTAAVVGSLGAHALALGALAILTGIGARGPGMPFNDTPLQATIVSAAPELTVSPPVPTPPADHLPTIPAPRTAILPVPLAAPAAAAAPKASLESHVAWFPDDGAAIDASIEQALAVIYPGAQRTVPEFDIEPQAVYPDAARRDRRQVFVRVVAVVNEDGSLALAEGTFGDPLFEPAIRAALASARVSAPASDRAYQPAWTVLTFYFESFASGESDRSRFEGR